MKWPWSKEPKVEMHGSPPHVPNWSDKTPNAPSELSGSYLAKDVVVQARICLECGMCQLADVPCYHSFGPGEGGYTTYNWREVTRNEMLTSVDRSIEAWKMALRKERTQSQKKRDREAALKQSRMETLREIKASSVGNTPSKEKE